jgi:hypothetical protein
LRDSSWSHYFHYYSSKILPEWVTSWCMPYQHQLRVFHMPTYSTYRMRYQLKAIHGLGFDALHDKILMAFEEDELMLSIRERFPDFFMECLEGTILAIYFDDRTKHITSTLCYRKAHIQSEELTKLLRGVDSPWDRTQMSYKELASLATLLMMCLAIFYRKRKVDKHSVLEVVAKELGIVKKQSIFESLTKTGQYLSNYLWLNFIRPLGGMTVGDFLVTIVSPILEEKFKLWNPFWCVIGISLFECMDTQMVASEKYPTGEPQFMFVPYRLPFKLITHGLMTKLTMKNKKVGILAHILWNTYVLYANAFRMLWIKIGKQFVTRENAIYFTHLQYPFLWSCLLITLLSCEDTNQKPTTMSLWKKFQDHYEAYTTYEGPPEIQHLSPNNKLEPVQSKMWPTEPARGHIYPTVCGKHVPVDVLKRILQEEPLDNHRLHPVVMSTAVMYTPANTVTNTVAALMYRIHKDPFPLISGLPEAE